jgi:hypothetical protein
LTRIATRLAAGSEGAAAPTGDGISSDTDVCVGCGVAEVPAGGRSTGERGDMIVAARIARLTIPAQAAGRGR